MKILENISAFLFIAFILWLVFFYIQIPAGYHEQDSKGEYHVAKYSFFDAVKNAMGH